MKFDLVFPKAVAGFEVFSSGPLHGVFRDKDLHSCFRCGEATYWYDILAEGLPVCSAECHGRFWNSWQEANKIADKLYGKVTPYV